MDGENNNIVVSSTTLSQSEVDAAASYNPSEAGPTRNVTLVSTTDGQEAVTQALQGDGEVIEGEAAEQQIAPKVPRVAVSGTNAPSPEQVSDIEQEMEQEREDAVSEYLGKGDKRLARQLRQISRLTGQRYQLREENEQLRSELARYKGQQPPPPEAQNGEAPHDGQPAPQPKPWGQFSQEELRVIGEEHGKQLATFPFRFREAEQSIPDLAKTLNEAKDVELPWHWP